MYPANQTISQQLKKAHKKNLQGIMTAEAIFLSLALFSVIFTIASNDFQINNILSGIIISSTLFCICLGILIYISILKSSFEKRLEMINNLITKNYTADRCFTWTSKNLSSVHFKKLDHTEQHQDIAIKMPLSESMIVMRHMRESIPHHTQTAIQQPTHTSYQPAPTSYQPAPTSYQPAPTSYYTTPPAPQPTTVTLKPNRSTGYYSATPYKKPHLR